MSILGKLGLKKEEQSTPSTPPIVGGEGRGKKPLNLKDTGQAYQILLRPVLSEKGTHLAASGKYVFIVNPNANKSEVRKSIQSVYGVHVMAVAIMPMPGKSRRYGRTIGRTAHYKKAIVTLRAGEKIAGIIEAVG